MKASRRVMYSGSSGSVFSVNLYGNWPFCLATPPSGYQLHLFFTNLPKSWSGCPCMASLTSCLVSSGHGKGFPLVDDVDVVLHLFSISESLGCLNLTESLLEVVITKGSHNVGTVFGWILVLFFKSSSTCTVPRWKKSQTRIPLHCLSCSRTAFGAHRSLPNQFIRVLYYLWRCRSYGRPLHLVRIIKTDSNSFE